MADQQNNDDSKTLTDIELERLKMYQDSFKHLTTFCSGAILLSAAVTGALFLPKPDFVLMLGVSIFLLALGAAAAMFGLVRVARYMDLSIDRGPEPALALFTLLLGSVGGAYFGLSIFAFFATVNLFLSP